MEIFKYHAAFSDSMSESIDEKTLKLFDELAGLQKEFLEWGKQEGVDDATAFYETTFLILNKAKIYGDKFYDQYMDWHKENQPEFYQYALDMIKFEGSYDHDILDLLPSYEYAAQSVARLLKASKEKKPNKLSSAELERIIIGPDDTEEDY